MPENGHSVETSASPETVWRTWSDVSTWPTWNPDIQAVFLPGGIAEGSKGTMTTNQGGTHNISISEVQPNRGFTLHSDLPMPATTLHFRCSIEPVGSGSRIGQSVTVTGLFSFMKGPITGRIVPTFEPLLDGLKRHVESAAPASAS
jgi:uncharacterized protein YndB with AHSA1/START domain